MSTPSADQGDNNGAAPRSIESLPPAAIELATRMFDAARTNNAPLLTQALGAGLPPNLTNAKGDTLLMLASYHGHLELTTMLLARGADPNVLNARGQSPLAGTVFKGEKAIAEALLRAGADPALGEPSARDAVDIFGVDRLVKDGEEGWGAMMDRARVKENDGATEGGRSRSIPGERNDIGGSVQFK